MYKKLAIVTGLFVATVSPSVLAQAQEGDVLRANIPFDFQIGNKSVSSGKYVIEKSGDVVYFRKEGGNFVALTLTMPESRKTAPATAVLEFNKYGDDYFLASIWTPYSNYGLALPKGKREKEVARLAGGLSQTAAVHINK